MRRRRLDLVVALAALLLLGLVGTTAGRVVAQGDTHIVLAVVPAQGQVASATALKATRAILVERLGAVRSLASSGYSAQVRANTNGTKDCQRAVMQG